MRFHPNTDYRNETNNDNSISIELKSASYQPRGIKKAVCLVSYEGDILEGFSNIKSLNIYRIFLQIITQILVDLVKYKDSRILNFTIKYNFAFLTFLE